MNNITSQNKQYASYVKANEEMEVVLYDSDELYDQCFVPNIFLSTESIATSAANNSSNNNSTTTINNNNNSINNEIESKVKSTVYVV